MNLLKVFEVHNVLQHHSVLLKDICHVSNCKIQQRIVDWNSIVL